ncbi:hypothetical protein GIB67_036860 [Kingdonia uniflora]|uniref:Pentatricopeptide repeat-containing protein n=1 Tax=Kingdonia uniflora TaxID=39325 RepID=A0A7J7LWV0_9MAGN|nr:hypothetical protein GIB67_036860 [Kingdonia uniflora]
MLKRGIKPNIVTYNAFIHGLSNAAKMEEAVRLWDELKIEGPVPDIFIYSVMINGYCKAKKLEVGEKLFNEVHTQKFAVVCNPLIRGYCENGNMLEAFRLPDQMKSRGIALTVVTYSTLTHGLCAVGRVEEAKNFIDEMRRDRTG